MDFKHILHNKLFLYGGGLLLLFVLVRMITSNKVSGGQVITSTGVAPPSDAAIQASAGLQATSIQANTQLALAQIGAAATASQTNAQLTAQTQTLQEQLAAKGIDADVAKYSIASDANVATQQVNAALVAQENNNDLQASIAKWTLDTSLAQQQSNNNFQLAYATNANATQVATANIIANVNLASIQAQRDLSVASIQAGVANTQTYVSGQVQINDSNNNKDVAVTQINSNTQKYVQGSGNVKGILGAIGGIAGLFSDRRLKRDITLLGRERDGLGSYAYRLIGDGSYQAGVMSDEVRRLRPNAIGKQVMGFDTVHYAAL